jgi:hypothetical protein
MFSFFTTSAISEILTNLVYVAIGFCFLLALVRCVAPVNRVKRRLLRAARVLKRNDEPNAWHDKAFLGKGALMGSWGEYLRNRLFADENYQNACSIEDYINETTAIDEPGNAALADIIPGLCVSLGFLGTLIGMMMGLGDFDISSADKTMGAMSVLINGMKFAFVTSIVGVIGSIGFSMISRITNSSALRALEKFYDAMKKFAGESSVDPINQIAIYQQEQSSMLQDITTNMTDRLGSVLEMSLQPIQSSLNDFVTAATREQIKGVDAIVSRFIVRMNESLKGQFDKLARCIEDTCQWQRETRDSVRLITDGLGRVSSDIIQVEQISESLIVKFDGYMTKLGAAQLQIDEGYAAITSNMKNVEVVSRQQANYIAQIEKMQADVRKDTHSFQTSMDSYMKSFTENTNISTGALKKVSDELHSNGDILSDAHKSFITGVNKELTRTFDMFDANMSNITNHLAYVINSIKEAVDKLPEVIGQGGAEFAKESERLIALARDLRYALENRQ